jgi:hypothetical protein
MYIYIVVFGKIGRSLKIQYQRRSILEKDSWDIDDLIDKDRDFMAF